MDCGGLGVFDTKQERYAVRSLPPMQARTPMTVDLHRFASPHLFLRIARYAVPIALAIFAIFGVIGAIWGLFIAPPDYQQGDSVRIMYIHVPSAWTALSAYALMTVASVANLIWRHPVAGLVARGAAVPGAVCTFIVLVTGSIWGKPMWGAWWAWGDARLTSMLVLFFIYVGYIALWNAFRNPMRAMRPASILCLVGAIDLPIIKFSVDWWNTLHQPASVLRMDGPTIHPSMLWPLLVMATAVFAFFIAVTFLSTRSQIREMRLASLRASRSPRVTVS